MFLCRLCGLTVEEIPEDAIQCGKLYRFTNGEYHSLRKQLAPRTGPRPRKNRNPDQEARMGMDALETKTNEALIGTNGETKSEAPTMEVTLIPANVIPANETAMARAFRLKKAA
jgi:hypothetical protein